MEYREMKECTFKPTINARLKRASSETKVEQVRGFESFCKKVEKTNLLKRDKKEREEKLFNLEKNYRSRKATNPK